MWVSLSSGEISFFFFLLLDAEIKEEKRSLLSTIYSCPPSYNRLDFGRFTPTTTDRQ
jgi:hypothetical protein